MNSVVRVTGHIARHRKTIAVDIDEVLCPFLLPMAKWKGLKIKKNNFPYVYRDIFDIPELKSREMVYGFYESDEFRHLEPIQGARSGITRLYDEGYKIYIVTGRQSRVRDETERWLNWNFPFQIHDLIMTNSYTPNELAKEDICKGIGANMIIDDNYDICVQCETNHIKALNFVGDPMYPWCEDSSLALASWRDLDIDKYLPY
jgi:5'(3')-deoxyribonucleotidase